MVTFREAVSEAVRAGYCGTVRREPVWFAGLRRLVVNPDSGLADAGRAFNKLICNSEDNPEDDFPQPDFTGGQCSTTYLVNLVNVGAGLPSTASAFATGPVSGTYRTGPNQFGAYAWFVNATPDVAFRTGNPGEDWKISSVSRTDAAPDNCGNIPIVFPDPGPITVNPPDITYEDNDNVSITVPIAIVYAPVSIRATGYVSIPITVDVGGITLNGELTLFPDFTVELFPDTIFNTPGTPDNPDLTDPEPGSEGEDDPDQTPPDVDLIIGVLINSNKDGNTRASEVTQDELPTLYAPRLGNTSFKVRTGRITGWTPPQPIQFTNQYVPCPSPYGAIDVRVWWDAGWDGSYSPVRGKPIGEP